MTRPKARTRRELVVPLPRGWRLAFEANWVHTDVKHDEFLKVDWFNQPIAFNLVRLGADYKPRSLWGWRLWIYTRRRQPYLDAKLYHKVPWVQR